MILGVTLYPLITMSKTVKILAVKVRKSQQIKGCDSKIIDFKISISVLEKKQEYPRGTPGPKASRGN